MKTGDEETFELSELCDRADVTPRTVRYYIQQGLLPAPGMGRGTKYDRGHLARLRLIRRLQREHLPLAEIRKRLERMDDAAVTTSLELVDEPSARSGSEPDAPSGSVSDYVASVLREPQARAGEIVQQVQRATSMRSRSASTIYERDRWDRYRLTDDVEIHVRRPLSRETNRRVERLLDTARKILGEEP